MTKNSKIIIAILLISNLTLIGFLLLGKGKKHKAHTPKETMIKKLEFDEVQTAEFHKLVEAHKDIIKKKRQNIATTKDLLYKGLKNEEFKINDSLVKKIADGVKEIETIHYEHFMEVKEMCNESQKIKFNELADELGRVFGRKKRPRRRN